MQYVRKKKKGFTMIELSLSMAIIGVMSVVMMMMISNAVSAYHKGLTLNQLNTVGMSLVEDIRVAIQSSPARSVADECVTMYQESGDNGAQAKCSQDRGASFVTQVRKGNVTTVDGDTYSNIPLEGIFCTGKWTYIWNSGYLMNEGVEAGGVKPLRLKYTINRNNTQATETTVEKARLLKVHDENRTICKTTAGYKAIGSADGAQSDYTKVADDPLAKYAEKYNRDGIIDISGLTVLDSAPEDLLENNGGLAIYDLAVTQPATVENLDVMFYAASMILGTLRGGPNITMANDTCKTPEDLNADFDYCAINKFNFAARAVGGTNAI